MKRTLFGLLSILACLLTSVLQLAVAQPAELAKPWPPVSDIAPDPAVTYGALANGMGYAIMPNRYPGRAVSIRFVVRAGSNDERDDEAGYAHFIEHLAFNSTVNVPEGDMVRRLQRLGLTVGSDLNATTGRKETVYFLDLPDNNASSLDEALFLLSEVADKITFTPAIVERERGVILAEYNRHDTFEQRRAEEQIAFLAPGASGASKWPIGREETIRAATAAQLSALYDRLYRPERAFIVIVGDIDVVDMQNRIGARFGGWLGRGAGETLSPKRYAPLQRMPAAHVFVHPAGGDSIAVYGVHPFVPLVDDVAARRDRIYFALATAALGRRLTALAEGPTPPFRRASASHYGIFDIVDVAAISAAVTPGEWRKGLEALDAELRRALLFGFSEAEIDQQIAAMRAAFTSARDQTASRTSSRLATEIASALLDGRIISSPADNLQRFEQWAKEASPQRVLEAFTRRMDLREPLFLLASTAPAPDAAAEIPRIWAEARRRPVDPPVSPQTANFAYTDFGSPGSVVEDRRLPEIDARAVRFANNVRLTVKRTALAEDSVLLSLRVGDGSIGLENGPFGLTALMSAYADGGLEEHDIGALRSILVGRKAQATFGVSADAFGGFYSTSPGDLELQLQLAAAFLTHPGFRPEAEQRWREGMVLSWSGLDAGPAAVFAGRAMRLLASGDRRFGVSPEDGAVERSFAELRAYTEDMRLAAPIEIAIVGDIDEQRAIDLVAKTFGALPARRQIAGSIRSSHPVVFREAGQSIVLEHKGEQDQALASIYWPVTFDPDVQPQRARVLGVLASIIRLKLVEELRERLGAAYAPTAAAAVSRYYPGLGYVHMTSEVKPEDIGRTLDVFRAIASDLRNGRISADELARAVEPSLQQLATHASENGYWLSLLSEAQSQPERMSQAMIASVDASLRAVTLEQLTAEAQAWLQDANGRETRILPAVSGTNTTGSEVRQ